MRSPTEEQIKALLKAHKVSQAKASDIALVSKSTMERMCRGQTKMHPWIWDRLQIELKKK